ncbi:hypothetical protein Tco_1167263 [Tanacetum coccineum]
MTLAASTSTDKSLKDFDELMSTPIDFFGYILNGLKIKNLTQETLLGPAFRLLKGTRSNYAELEYDFKECYKALSEKLDWENPKGGDYPFNLSKPLPLIMRGNRQRSKAAKYDLPGIEVMVPNIWSMLKLLMIDMRYGVSHIRENNVSFYAYARGIQSRGDVYSTKHILAVTHVKINDIEDMLILVVHNRLINVPGDDVPNFPIALRMFTKSLASFFARIHNQKYQHGVLAEEKMEQFRKEKSSFHDQGHQQAANGKKNDEEFREIHWWSILMDSKEYLKMVIERQSVKVKEIQERCINKAFQDYQIKKEAQRSHSCQVKRTSSNPKSMITTSNHKLMIEVKDYELKTEVKA